ncbi:kinesin-domain-containing protein [Hortaea werneckii]|nr:kinesin-domain-containing protein [Hortaea werneckii]
MAVGADGGASSIQVAVRVRPFTIREAAQLTKSDDGPLFLGDGSLAAVPAPQLKQKGLRPVIKVMDERCLVFDPPEDNPVQRFSRSVLPAGKRVKDQTFGFDRVFDDNTTQADVYEATTKNLLDSVMDGYNATVFAYGATGCGKTHTITGSAQQPGIIFLTMQELFEKVDEAQAEKESEITLSYLEIYNEQIRDLLNPGTGGKQGLMLREDANQAVSVAGLSSHKPQNVQEVMDMVIRGNGNRTQSPTEANATSSRSHAVLQVNISLKDRNASTTEPVTMATLSIIDLAGSERASATKNRGERLLEGANINKSLLALGSCINALCDPRKKNHVPYRNSKLTRLLKFSLGGNCRTVMIVCVSPSSQHFDETQNTLRYANRAKNIQTKSVRNVYNVDRHVKDYLKKIDEQMSRINELTAQQKQYEELAFVKFRKAEAKRVEVLAEGMHRLRLAYDHSSSERNERTANLKRLRQVERRIGAISGWIGAFDSVCDAREDEEPSPALQGMRKTATGILVELEGSRQYCHQRLTKSNWTRAVDTALSDGLRQLAALEGGGGEDSTEEASLRKEAEMLRQRAEVEAHISVLEQDKSGEAGLMSVLLTAHFETIAILNQILQMSEEEAVAAAREVLGKLLQSCTEATGQVIKPDGGLQITEAVPPTKNGTPRKRKQMSLMGPSPMKSKVRQSISHDRNSAAFPSGLPPHMASEMQSSRSSSSPADSASPRTSLAPTSSSPAPRSLSSPRRRVKVGGAARKGVSFSAGGAPQTQQQHQVPSRTASKKKSSPSKKRVVRWRDDAEDAGPLVEFQATPKKTYAATSSSPMGPESPQRRSKQGVDGDASEMNDEENSSQDDVSVLPPSISGKDNAVPSQEGDAEPGSSPLPPPPVSSAEGRKSLGGSGRFATGFLSKKGGNVTTNDGTGNEGSPTALPPQLNRNIFPTESGSSDDEASPLRDISGNSAPRVRPSSSGAGGTIKATDTKENTTDPTSTADDSSKAGAGSNGGAAASSDIERSLLSDKETAGKIRSALKPSKRSSSSSSFATYGPSNTAARQASREHKAHRRRSPTASSAAAGMRDSSPPSTTTASSVAGGGGGSADHGPGPGPGPFSATHARRMDGSGSWNGRSVLSPRSQAVGKHHHHHPGSLANRRSMMDLGSTSAAQATAAGAGTTTTNAGGSLGRNAFGNASSSAGKMSAASPFPLPPYLGGGAGGAAAAGNHRPSSSVGGSKGIWR